MNPYSSAGALDQGITCTISPSTRREPPDVITRSLTLASASPSEAVAVVPLSAIVRSKDRPDEYSLFVIEGEGGAGRARLRTVTLGDAYGNRDAVKEGVSVGDRVITSGGSRLVDGEIVQAIP